MTTTPDLCATTCRCYRGDCGVYVYAPDGKSLYFDTINNCVSGAVTKIDEQDEEDTLPPHRALARVTWPEGLAELLRLFAAHQPTSHTSDEPKLCLTPADPPGYYECELAGCRRALYWDGSVLRHGDLAMAAANFGCGEYGNFRRLVFAAHQPPAEPTREVITTAQALSALLRIKTALDEHDAAYKRRDHGGIADHNCVVAVREAMELAKPHLPAEQPEPTRGVTVGGIEAKAVQRDGGEWIIIPESPQNVPLHLDFRGKWSGRSVPLNIDLHANEAAALAFLRQHADGAGSEPATKRLAKCGHIAYRDHDNMCVQDGCPSAAYAQLNGPDFPSTPPTPPPAASSPALPDGEAGDDWKQPPALLQCSMTYEGKPIHFWGYREGQGCIRAMGSGEPFTLDMVKVHYEWRVSNWHRSPPADLAALRERAEVAYDADANPWAVAELERRKAAEAETAALREQLAAAERALEKSESDVGTCAARLRNQLDDMTRERDDFCRERDSLADALTTERQRADGLRGELAAANERFSKLPEKYHRDSDMTMGQLVELLSACKTSEEFCDKIDAEFLFGAHGSWFSRCPPHYLLRDIRGLVWGVIKLLTTAQARIAESERAVGFAKSSRSELESRVRDATNRIKASASTDWIRSELERILNDERSKFGDVTATFADKSGTYQAPAELERAGGEWREKFVDWVSAEKETAVAAQNYERAVALRDAADKVKALSSRPLPPASEVVG